MKESSSRYVDQITLEKLVTEKLEKVHHYPHTGLQFPKALFDDWSGYREQVELALPKSGSPISIGKNLLQFQSMSLCEHDENHGIPVHCFMSESPVCNLVFYHGLFEENREIYYFLFSNLNRLGVNVYLCTMPYHYERMPSQSAFSGEFFWSAYFERTRNAFKQAVYDLHMIARWVATQSTLPVIPGGFSMGGSVALIYGAIEASDHGVVALNPAVSLSEIVWDSPLCRTIKSDYMHAGYAMPQLQSAYREFEPICYSTPKTPIDRIFLGYGSYDLVTAPDLYRTLVAHWQLPHYREYKSGHLNLLRVPRVANDVFSFLTQHGIQQNVTG